MSALRFLFQTRAGLAVLAAVAVAIAFVSFVAVVRPAWAIDPLREAAMDVLSAMGVALALLVLWSAWVVWLFSRGFLVAVRRWRYVIGFGVLVAGAFAVLSYFTAELPLIGRAPLGGDLGGQFRGSGGAIGVLRTLAIVLVGAWFVVPKILNALAKRTGKAAAAGASKSARAYRAAPLHVAAGRAIRRGAVAGARRVSETRRNRALARDLEHFESDPPLSFSAGAEPPSYDMDAPPVPDAGESPGSSARAGAALRSPAAAAVADRPAVAVPDDEDESDFYDDRPKPLGPPVRMPSFALLAPPVPAVAVSEEHENTARDIEEALAQYGVEVRVNEIRPGPSVTMFGLVPGWKQIRTPDDQPDRGSRVKVNSILARKNDLALALKCPGLRVEPVPGESLVMVEAPGVANLKDTAELIVDTLAEHGIDVVVKEVRRDRGGAVFGLEPGWNRRARPVPEAAGSQIGGRVRVQSILAREKDLALALAAPSLRIQAPVPGESIVGIEVPNKSSSLVTIRTVMESDEYERAAEAGGLPVALGLAPAGEPVAIDLTKMPHLLIAGSTGSGKSVCMNTIISSLIKDQPPSKVRMLLVDPKRVELTPYNGIPHLVTPVVVEPDQVVRLLRGAVQEMNRRYRLLEDAGVRNIQSYNKSPRASEFLPFFVICIDELADLMMTAPADVETCLVRLAQLSRAVGIHLVVATQRPSVNVITGLIKANFPSRIAFYVASQVDSRTILDFGGAESLLGRGDMLFLSSDSPKARRVQGVFISEEETGALSNHWRNQPPDPNLQEIPLEDMAREVEIAEAESGGPEFGENDSLYDRALQVASANRQLSTSLLQRRLRIGYPRAARLMDQLEDEGIVASTGEPGKPREVLYIPD